MSELHGFSRLPREQAYWDGLQSRVLDAVVEAGPGPERRATWMSPLAGRAWALGGLALAAAVATLLLLPGRDADRPASPAGILRAPADDPSLVAFVTATAPPPLASLMVHPSRAQRHD